MAAIKILHIIENLERGGAELMIANALTRIDRNAFEPEIAYLMDKPGLQSELTNAGVRLHALGLKNYDAFINAITALTGLIKRNRYDIVHTHLYFANIYGRIAARLAGCRNIVTTLHNPDYSYEDTGAFTYQIRKYADRLTGRLCNRGFLAVSDFVKRDFEKQLGFDHINVLYNGIDIRAFQAQRNPEVRKTAGIPETDTVILHIGRFTDQKGQDTLIKAFSRVQDTEKNTSLVLIGKGPREASLRKLASGTAKEKIFFLNNITNIPEFMAACDIFVFPSRYEGFGIALVEAMAQGMPVIASDIETLREIITDGQDGMLVDCSDAHLLGESIVELLRNKTKMLTLGKNAHAKVSRLFTIESHVSDLQKYYRRIVERNKGN